MLQYGQIIKIIESPRDVTYREMLSIIKVTKSPIELTEAARMASQKNEQIRNYLGTRLNVKNNWKLRAVREKLLNHPSIKQVNDKPIVLLYSEDNSPSFEHISSRQCDVSEVCDDGNAKTSSTQQLRTHSVVVSSNDKEIRLSKVTGTRSDVSEVCDDDNYKEIRLSKVTGTRSDVSEVCDDDNGKTSSSQLSMDVIHRTNDNSKHRMDGTSHTSHTSPSLNVHGISKNKKPTHETGYKEAAISHQDEDGTSHTSHTSLSKNKEPILEAFQRTTSDSANAKHLTSDASDRGPVLRHSSAAYVLTNDDLEDIENSSSNSNNVGESS
jgi:hypothetical protein